MSTVEGLNWNNCEEEMLLQKWKLAVQKLRIAFVSEKSAAIVIE